MTIYTAICERSGGWWAVSIQEVEGAFTQARRLDQVADMAADALSLLLDSEVDPGDIEIVPRLDPEVDEVRKRAGELRDLRSQLDREITHTMDQVVRILHDERGFSMRDIGSLLGVSHQRISQILSSPWVPGSPDWADLQIADKLAQAERARRAAS